MTNETTPQSAAYTLESNTTAEYAIARRAVVLAQVAAYEHVVKTLKEEAAFWAKQAGLTKSRDAAILSS